MAKVGAIPETFVECCRIMLVKENNWQNPFGDGKAGERIVKILEEAQG
jgi:UDP-N-acetylglucosamine 2-epimerase (non-hydrolysing)